MKQILTLLLALLPLGIWAQKSLVVNMKDGSQQAFLLSKSPSVSVSDDKVLVSLSNSVSAEIPLVQVSTFTFSEPTAINAVSQEGAAVAVSKESLVEAFTIGGKSLGKRRLGDLKGGAYIVKTNGKSIKIIAQ